jgi:primary-amine oxidase
MCIWPNGSLSRRGQEMVVWGTWDTGNYDYVIEYTFRDDGQISFRLGATGFNNPSLPALGHMHDILWRVDLDLNGSGNDTAVVERHTETGLTATDSETAFNNGVEGALALDPLAFETLVIEDAAVNAHGNHYGYELHPFRRGISRHAETWTQKDVWVTRYRPQEPAVPASWSPPDSYLTGTAQTQYGIYDSAPINGQDIVIWHSSPIHHEPHDEDQAPGDPGNTFQGLTLIHWTGFDLVPRNLFDANPIGAPYSSQCQ